MATITAVKSFIVQAPEQTHKQILILN